MVRKKRALQAAWVLLAAALMTLVWTAEWWQERVRPEIVVIAGVLLVTILFAVHLLLALDAMTHSRAKGGRIARAVVAIIAAIGLALALGVLVYAMSYVVR